MQHIIRETITLIRIERWLVSDGNPDSNTVELASERIVEEIVLRSTETAHVDELVRHLVTNHPENPQGRQSDVADRVD